MFEKKNLVFYYCTSPLHMGAGTSIGAIDNPIQREIHTNHPIISGSGLKGAIRHHLTFAWQDRKNDIVSLFGSEGGKSETVAGAVSCSDANLVALPVRSVKNTYVYAASLLAIARLKRQAQLAGIKLDWNLENIKTGFGASTGSLVKDKLCLEAYEFASGENDEIKKIATWIAENCLDGAENLYFQEKIKKDFFVLRDDDFNHFVKHSTTVEPHVRIDDATGTAAEGALFYTENLPPETILCGVVLTSVERKEEEQRKSAEECSNLLLFDAQAGISGKLVQMGGDATTGRGLVMVKAIKAS